MKLYGISLCLALVVAVKASELGFGLCATFQPLTTFTQGGKDSSINAISSFGELAVVAHDPNDEESLLRCISMKFDSGKKEYIIKYKDEHGIDVMKNGTYTVEKEFIVPLFNTKIPTTFYDMPDLKGLDMFGDGKMFPMYVGKNEVILKGCSSVNIASFDLSTYMLIPIAKAVENKGCNCPEWKKSIE